MTVPRRAMPRLPTRVARPQAHKAAKSNSPTVPRPATPPLSTTVALPTEQSAGPCYSSALAPQLVAPLLTTLEQRVAPEEAVRSSTVGLQPMAPSSTKVPLSAGQQVGPRHSS